jgi:hypothetical protein
MTLAEARPVGQVEEDRQEAYRVPANFPRILGRVRSKEERMLEMARALLDRYPDPEPKPFGAKQWMAVMKARDSKIEAAAREAEAAEKKARKPRARRVEYESYLPERKKTQVDSSQYWHWREFENLLRAEARKQQLEFSRQNFQAEYADWKRELNEVGHMTYGLLKRAREYGFVVSDNLTPKQELDYSI